MDEYNQTKLRELSRDEKLANLKMKKEYYEHMLKSINLMINEYEGEWFIPEDIDANKVLLVDILIKGNCSIRTLNALRRNWWDNEPKTIYWFVNNYSLLWHYVGMGTKSIDEIYNILKQNGIYKKERQGGL